MHSIASRTVSLISRLPIEEKILFTGGLTKSTVIKNVLAEKLGEKVHTSAYSQQAGALGAAIIGWNELHKGKT